MSDSILLRKMYLPKDTNHMGKVFGGAILADIDIAGAIAAMRVVTNPDVANVVTRSIKEVEFLCPVEIGRIVTYNLIRATVGRTSIKVTLQVESEPISGGGETHIAATDVIYVALDELGQKTWVSLP